MDEIEIAGLVYRSAEYADGDRLDELTRLFRHARLKLVGDGRVLEGKELAEYWRQELARRHHGAPSQQLLTNLMIDIDRETNTARCRSSFATLCASSPGQLQIESAGYYRDEFRKVDSAWQFAMREQTLLGAGDPQNASSQGAAEPDTRKPLQGSPVKARILLAARQVFSTVGYSEAGIRKIADVVGLSPTILFRHFGTKAGLFEEALVQTMAEREFTTRRENFGRHVANMLADPGQISCPHSMSILATGNAEAREIVAKVMERYAIKPIAAWLGEPDGLSRARKIMALCAGFVLYHSQLNASGSGRDEQMVEWLACTLQEIVDR